MMPDDSSVGGDVVLVGDAVLPTGVLADANVVVRAGRIAAIAPSGALAAEGARRWTGLIAPGFVDLHVHGGAGADFMDGDADAFATVLRAHARHGTTSLAPTSTVADDAAILAFLHHSRHFQRHPIADGARVVGAHLYGPYFGEMAAGCHPKRPLRPPTTDEFERYLAFADAIRLATVAPELPGAEAFARACVDRGIRVNIGHSHATFEQVEAAIGWGARHVDHLFCAMSDRALLRRSQAYPMRGGVMEATLFFDELTTEVIADGKHLQPELLRLALKAKGRERLALVTDCSRALDMPDGDYMFGPRDGGEPFRRANGVGVMPDGSALASSVMGMDHMVRTFHQATGCDLAAAVALATRVPARILGLEHEIGSLTPGLRADFVLLSRELDVVETWRDGAVIWRRGSQP